MDPSVPTPALCAAAVTVSAAATSSAATVWEDWKWPYTTAGEATRILPPAAATTGIRRLSFTELSVGDGGGEALEDPVPAAGVTKGRTFLQGDTVWWSTIGRPATSTTYRVAYTLDAGQATVRDIGRPATPPTTTVLKERGGGSPCSPSPTSPVVAPPPRLSVTWSPGEWEQILSAVTVTFILPPGAVGVASSGPTAGGQRGQGQQNCVAAVLAGRPAPPSPRILPPRPWRRRGGCRRRSPPLMELQL